MTTDAPTTGVERFLALMGKIPTTQGHVCVAAFGIVVTMSVYGALAVWTTLHGTAPWEPSIIWLGFLASLLGIATTQFGIKRTTDTDYVATKLGNTPPQPSNDPKGTTQ